MILVLLVLKMRVSGAFSADFFPFFLNVLIVSSYRKD